jgi:hypothetical protein
VPDRPRRQRPLAAGPALAREIAIKVGELRWPELGELDVRDRAAALPDLAVAADGRPAATACLDVGDVALEAASKRSVRWSNVDAPIPCRERVTLGLLCLFPCGVRPERAPTARQPFEVSGLRSPDLMRRASCFSASVSDLNSATTSTRRRPFLAGGRGVTTR